ncbi:hypothetical protein [Microbulbifer agarilyticus]
MRTIEFTLNNPSPSANELLRMDRSHWAIRRKFKKQLAMEVLAAIVNSGQRRPNEPLSQVFIEIQRGSAGVLDEDNLHGGLKPLLDTFVMPTRRNPHGLGLIRDDHPGCIVERRVLQVPAKRGQGFTRVLIAEVLE